MAKIRKDSKGRNLRPGEYQRNDGLYAYGYTLYGKRMWIYATDLADLRKQAKQIEKDRDDGIRTQDASKISLNDMFETYMATKQKLKESTAANYRYMWKKYLAPTDLARKPICNVKKSDIQKLYSDLLSNGFASNSLECINNLVHPTLEMAVDDDLIRKNPSKGVYRAMKENDAKPRIALTVPEQQAFLNYISKSHTYNHWSTVFVTLLGTGLRVGELLNPHCLNRAIDRICRDYNEEETALAKDENREPLLLPHFSVHNLRHTFCTRLFEVEKDFKFIQQMMGHAEISTTMDIYTHITNEQMKSSVHSLSENFSLF